MGVTDPIFIVSSRGGGGGGGGGGSKRGGLGRDTGPARPSSLVLGRGPASMTVVPLGPRGGGCGTPGGPLTEAVEPTGHRCRG